MANLTAIERSALNSVLQISGGYILYELYSETGKNKTFTQQVIKEATGIDIYSNSDYKGLSQQKSFEKIIDECDDKRAGKMIKSFFDFYKTNNDLCEKNVNCSACAQKKKCDVVKAIIDKLIVGDVASLPQIKTYDELVEELKELIASKMYSLAVDRLHTFSLKFLQEKCEENQLSPNKDKKGHIMFDDMITQLATFYKAKDLINDFSNTVFVNSKLLFQKYNATRNNQSYAHANDIIDNRDARFVVDSILAIINYIDAISKN